MALARSLVLGIGVVACLVSAFAADATPVAFTGTITVDFSDGVDGRFGPLSIPIAGMASVSGGTVSIAAGEITVSGSQTPVTNGAPFTRMEVTFANGAGSFVPNGAPPGSICGVVVPVAGLLACVEGGGLGGTMPLMGNFRFYTAPTLPALIDIVLTSGASGVGIGGELSASALAEVGPWTTRNVSVSTAGTAIGTNGGLSGPLGVGGTLLLVTPMAIDLGNGALPSLQFAGWVELELQFVPEPQPLLLFGTAFLAAGFAGSRKGR